MPRARRKTTSTAKTKSRAKRAPAPSAASKGSSFVCPECGKTFTRAAALGAHRRRAHGVLGRSAQAARARTTSASANGKRTSSPRTRAASDGAPRRTRGGVDRDRLLATLFPNGIPAREDVISELSGWLAQAEKLARLG
jgi:hypothetical protein